MAKKTEVHFTKGLNRVLSNLAESPFTFRGKKFKTAEGAYQAFKSGKYVTGFEGVSGSKAKSLGSTVKVDKGISESLMKEVLTAKHQQVPEFSEALKSSGQISHPVSDKFWAQKFPEILEGLKNPKPTSTTLTKVRSGVEISVDAEMKKILSEPSLLGDRRLDFGTRSTENPKKYSNQTYTDLDPEIKSEIVREFEDTVREIQDIYTSKTKPRSKDPIDPRVAEVHRLQTTPNQKLSNFPKQGWKGTRTWNYKNTGLDAPDIRASNYIKGLVDLSKDPNKKTIRISGHDLPSEVVRKIADTDLVTATWRLNFEEGEDATKFRVYSPEAKQILQEYAGDPEAMAKAKKLVVTRHIDIPEAQRFRPEGGQYVEESPYQIKGHKRKPDLVGTLLSKEVKIVPQDVPVSPSSARNKSGTIIGMDLPDKDLPKSTVLTEISKELHDVVGTTPEDVPEGFVDNAGFVDEKELKNTGYRIIEKGETLKPEAGSLTVQHPVLSTDSEAKRARELGLLIVDQDIDRRGDTSASIKDTELEAIYTGRQGKEKSKLYRERSIESSDTVDRSAQADAKRSVRVTEQDFFKEKSGKLTKDLQKIETSIEKSKKVKVEKPSLAVSWDIEKPVTLKQATDVARKTTETILSGSQIDRGKPHKVLDVSLLNEGNRQLRGQTIDQIESFDISQSLDEPEQTVQSRERSWKSKLVKSRGTKILGAILSIPVLDAIFAPLEVAQAYDTVIKPRQLKYGGTGLASGRDRNYEKVVREGIKKSETTALTDFKNWGKDVWAWIDKPPKQPRSHRIR